jgi:integrase
MAYIRQLESGLWAATVRTPAGRITETRELRGAVKAWADGVEADISRGEFLDPRLAKHTVGEVWEKYAPARRVEMASRKRDESHWKVWVAPRWAAEPIGGIVKPDVQAWVNELEEQGVGGWTIIAALNVLKATLELAVDAGWIRANPARRVRPPVAPSHVDRVIDAGEEVLILDRLDELFPGRRDARLFVETMLETGGRWEEVAAVRARRSTCARHGRVRAGDGARRHDPRVPEGCQVEEPPGVPGCAARPGAAGRLRPVVLATDPGGLVFTAPQGGSLLYPTWLRRVWRRALREPVPLVADPLPTPHDCRHTFGTRLADAGIPVHDRMALMGHKDVRSGQRYTHSGDRRFDAARDALRRARAGS